MDSIVTLLKNNRWFLFLSISFLLSGIGTSFTQVLVFGQLIDLKATDSEIALNFVLVTLANIISLYFGAKISYKFKPFTIFLFCEILSITSLVIPLYAITHQNIFLLNVTTLVPGICSGLTFIAYTTLIKNSFTESDYESISIIESLLFAGVILIGTGVGLVVYKFLSPYEFIYFDAILSVIVIFVFLLIKSIRPSEPLANDQEKTSTYALKNLRGEKLQTFLLPLILYITTAPAMSLLPTIGKKFNDIHLMFGLILSSGVALIFARGIGQILGPIVLGKIGITDKVKNINTIIYLFIGFISLYSLVFLFNNVYVVLFMVVFAHILSNIVFAVSIYMMYACFSETEIVYYSTKSYQLGNFILLIVSLLCVYFVQYFSVFSTYLMISAISFTSLLYVKYSNSLKLKPQR
ncbi:MFS transporter [Acinetobacter nectaris]|uniref:MFS transporter n=1 Tax=Acinetobacter nectaris TaxID=1219382 RepID=UPI001F01E600|nr:MFS transporter [Acinetobacter nectaris]